MKYVNSLILLIISSAYYSQEYPQGYFKFPIRPGVQNFLAGTFGELRSNHFHSGIDIKTQGKEGLEVIASADGYVSRIKITRGGYGKALYIDHPNGFTTVYAHLKKFSPEIDAIIRNEQYRKKSFTVNFFPKKEAIRVKKGEVVAFSGNTGGSSGPHLHYEIRNSKQEPINPLLFGFKEIEDHVCPSLRSIAITPLAIESRVEGAYKETIFQAVKIKEGKYSLKRDTINVHGPFHLNLNTIDLLDGVPNKNGIYSIRISVDDTLIYELEVDKFSFANTRMINDLINYRVYKNIGQRFYKVKYNAKNGLSMLNSFRNDGIIKFDDKSVHKVIMAASDYAGNTSSLIFYIQNHQVPNQNSANTFDYKILGDVMVVDVPLKTNKHCVVSRLGLEENVSPAYSSSKSTTYLIDLNHLVPEKIAVDTFNLTMPYIQQVKIDKDYTFNIDQYEVKVPKGAVFESMYFLFKNDSSGYNVGDLNNPLYKNITVKKQLSIGEYTNVYSKYGRSLGFQGCKIAGNETIIKTRSFGEFVFEIDSVPPQIKEVVVNKDKVVLKISDNLSGIGKINAYLNGNWLLMNYDYKTAKIWAEPLKNNSLLSGDLLIEVTDNQGNITKFAKKIP